MRDLSSTMKSFWAKPRRRDSNRPEPGAARKNSMKKTQGEKASGDTKIMPALYAGNQG